MKEAVEVFAGNISKWQADIFQEVLIGEIQHSIRCCRPGHCRDHVNDLVSVWLFQVYPPAACNAGAGLKIRCSAILG